MKKATKKKQVYLFFIVVIALYSCQKDPAQQNVQSNTSSSSQGKYLLFDSDQFFNLGYTGAPVYTTISYADINGTTITPVTAPRPGYYNFRARWSPDGKHIIFISSDDSDRSVCVIDIDGSNLKILTNGNEVNYCSFSPDSKKITYAKSIVSTLPLKYDIYTANADGSSEKKITSFGSDNGTTTDIIRASDNKIYFYAVSDHANAGVYCMDSDGNNLKYILTDVTLLDISPDAKHILFDLGDGLYTCSIDGTNITRILQYHNSGPDVLAGASWSHDGNQIFFSNQDYPTNYGIFSVNSNGTGLKKIMTGYYEFPQIY